MINFFERIADLVPTSKAKSAKIEFEFGEQDVMDIMSYDGLQEAITYVEIDDLFIRTLYISGYPYIASLGWLDTLNTFNHNIDISYHFTPVASTESLPRLTRKITELESTRRAMVRAGKIIGPELSDPLESATNLREQIMRGQERLFQISIYIGLRANSLDELEALTKQLQTELGSRLFLIQIARYRQTEALASLLPRGENSLMQRRNLNSSAAALTFPLVSSELIQESGILYGINTSTNSLVILDRFALNNANSIVFAQSGSGKSYASKVEILRQLMVGTNVLVIDPEREYLNLCESVHGTYIKLSAQSSHKINPFDFATSGRSREQLNEHIQDLTEILSLMAGGLDGSEIAAVDKALLIVYEACGENTPILRDLYAELHNLGFMSLCERLEKYISGSLAGVFNEPTNITLSNRLVVFDIKDMPESLRQIMMMIVANYIQNEIKIRLQKRLLVIDEGWMLLEHEQSAKFITGLVRRARKYQLGLSIISQQANDFLHSEYGRVIAAQSSLRILMRQDTTTIKGVTNEFNLSSWEANFLLTCERGDAIIIADNHHVAVRIIASPVEHPLITTSVQEVIG